jgi:starch synthase (maltosyl-transferring)
MSIRRSGVPQAQSATGSRAVGVDSVPAIAAPRIVIEHVSPCVDHGAYPAKGIVGQRLVVECALDMAGYRERGGALRADALAWQ